MQKAAKIHGIQFIGYMDKFQLCRPSVPMADGLSMMNTLDSDNTLILSTITMVGILSTVGDSHCLTCSGGGHLVVQRP